MPRRARILGSGGFFPTGTRETNCLLVLGGDGPVVVDAGTGLRRLLLDRALLEGATALDLVLTHFHADHVAGLAFLAHQGLEVRLWGPGAALYGRPTRELLDAHFGPPVREPSDVLFSSVEDLPVGELELGGMRVRTRAQEHHAIPTMGLRFGDRLAWVTDTGTDAGTAPFAAGVEVLCHEAWGHGPDPQGTASHTPAADAARIAQEARAGRLVLIHVPPQGDHEALLAEARVVRPDAELATDGLELLP